VSREPWDEYDASDLSPEDRQRIRHGHAGWERFRPTAEKITAAGIFWEIAVRAIMASVAIGLVSGAYLVLNGFGGLGQ
jgi:hypothetical protein